MKYEVIVPLAGFESDSSFIYEKFDNFFSSIKSEESGIELKMMNFDVLKNLDFELPEWFVEKLDIKNPEDVSIYFIFVLQSPATSSVVNLFAPVIMNNKNFTMGQIQLDLDEAKLETIENLICS
ncbi:MAG: flagellar assembly protein FliW [Arcobacteraceae bacterium]|nr:flagellar assembly protein FliW [Arcobacteraceae bacterium]